MAEVEKGPGYSRVVTPMRRDGVALRRIEQLDHPLCVDDILGVWTTAVPSLQARPLDGAPPLCAFRPDD